MTQPKDAVKQISLFRGISNKPKAFAMQVPTYFSGLPETGSRDLDQLISYCEAFRSDTLAALPWIAAEIAGREGFPSLMACQRHVGGRRLYIPRTPADLACRFGVDIRASTHAAIHKAAAPGLVVDMPSSWGIFSAIRRSAIRRAVAADCPADQITRMFGISRRILRHTASRETIPS
ncbi:hypothetical protein [Maricaulis sp. CAU 1757]